jgi:hypothetical protein
MEAFTIAPGSGVHDAGGTVLEITDGMIEVWTDDGTLDAKRAVSCLVTPEPGDRVLLARDGPDAYVLAVLDRPAGGGIRLEADGGLTVELRSGGLRISADEDIDLVSRRTVSVAAKRVEACAGEGSVLLGSARLVAGAVDSVFERLSQSVKRVFRYVEQVDHLRAGRIDHAAEGTARLHGEHTFITARELVKADGPQIHLG